MRRILPAVAALVATVLLAGCSAIFTRPTPEERIGRKDFRWPLEGTVSSSFGQRGSGRHEGIDIIAPAGTPVRASSDGAVSYAGSGLRGYGNAVLLDHGDGVSTLYGHLDAIRVLSAEAVRAGDVVGTVGRTGNATASHLHFELRLDGKAVDPAAHLKR